MDQRLEPQTALVGKGGEPPWCGTTPATTQQLPCLGVTRVLGTPGPSSTAQLLGPPRQHLQVQLRDQRLGIGVIFASKPGACATLHPGLLTRNWWMQIGKLYVYTHVYGYIWEVYTAHIFTYEAYKDIKINVHLCQGICIDTRFYLSFSFYLSCTCKHVHIHTNDYECLCQCFHICRHV